ncbi:dynein axonemal intermediate chain 4-like [Parasteatoda tepidariorum]|uniref:dynein axonemal intermediate chain 4-like n=1 Tax=Parasteatoda tepidariorum TaxID=114398 RepID=UPI001C723BD2|nr:dynein axonemal intermediate chain 4-like [Parasteatoda tepidariorum]
MMKEVIYSWLEEGFSKYDKSLEDDKKQEHTVFPLLISEIGVKITPNPLFSVYLGETELDSSFLTEYLDTIQDSLRQGKKRSEGTHSTIENIDRSQSSAIKKNKIEIDYERKNIFLSSKIIPLFEIADTYISNWSPEYQNVFSKNNNYKQALDYCQKFPSNFQDKSTLIGTVDVSVKQIETTPIILEDKSFLVNAYLMGKHYSRKELYVKPTPKTFQQYIESRTTFRDFREFHHKLPENLEILKRMKTKLYVIEKALNYNTNEKTIVSFSSSVDPSELSSALETKQSECSTISQVTARQCLEFYLPTLKNKYSVTCIESNPLNPSIFVCGYSTLSDEETEHEARGIVLCWTINKCGYPERIYYLEEAVTSIDISESKPYLIAVGMRYGLVAVIDLQQSDNTSYVTNRSSKDRPVGTIKSIRWMLKRYSLNETVEILLAVSVDGFVTSWKYRKDLEGNVLTTIKKELSEQKANKQFHISNATLCMCMHPNPDNDDIFAVGTIEGKVFILNLNNPDDHITIKNCHFGSVNDIKWSPLAKNVFFTCSTDRYLHIWELDKTKPSKTLILPDNILSMSLSSINSTLFSAITKHRLYIYDLSTDLHKPIVEVGSKENAFTALKFCPYNDWLFVGQSDGKVVLFEVTHTVSKLRAIESDILRNIFLPE